jgi:hypothetical protein
MTPLAFRFIACDQHPDHDTLASFRRRHGEQFAATFVQVLQIARENQVSRFGTVSLDGTKIHANASRHSALSYAHAEKIEAQLKAEVQEMLKLAEAADPERPPRRGQSARRDQAARRPPGRHSRSQDQDRSAGQGTPRARAGRVSKPSWTSARPRKRPTARSLRQTAEAAAGGPAPGRPDQPDRRRVAHHEGGWWRLRAVLQRPSAGR